MSRRYQHGLYDPKFNPSEGLDNCAGILAFLQETLTWPPDSPITLTEDAFAGLASILGLVEAAVREVSEVVGAVEMHCSDNAKEALKRVEAAIKQHT